MFHVVEKKASWGRLQTEDSRGFLLVPIKKALWKFQKGLKLFISFESFIRDESFFFDNLLARFFRIE
jgi:hypothetical protein